MNDQPEAPHKIEGKETATQSQILATVEPTADTSLSSVSLEENKPLRTEEAVRDNGDDTASPQKTGRLKELQSALRKRWKQPGIRYGTIAVLGILLLSGASWPTSRA